MATYTELEEVGRDEGMRDKILAAIAVAADGVRTEDVGTANHAERLVWARQAMSNLGTERDRFLPMVLAANKSAAKAQILDAADATIQSNVDALVDFFAV